MTLIASLERAAQSSQGVRFIDRREQATQVSYADICRSSEVMAAALHARGVRAGDRVAIILPTCRDFITTFMAVLRVGAVAVPLYPPSQLGKLAEYHTRTSAMLRKIATRMVVTQHNVAQVLGETIAGAAPPLGCVTADALQADIHPWQPATILPDSLALIQFSSGTTVDPKPVSLTHRQIIANIDAMMAVVLMRYPQAHRVVSWLPLYHDMGLIGGLLTPLHNQLDLTLLAPEVFVTRPVLWLRAISHYHGTLSPAPNFAYSLCTERVADEDLQGIDLSSWCVALNGAEPVTASVLKRFNERFMQYGLNPNALTPVYGLAEAALAVTFSDFATPFQITKFDATKLEVDEIAVASQDADARQIVNVGTPLPGYKVRITRDDGTAAPPTCIGHVWVRGPSLMQGYFNNAEATSATMRDGWLNTGDRGFIFDGQLYLHGRYKDVVILRGRKYAAHDIEQALDDILALRTGCSVAVSHLAAQQESEQLYVFCERRAHVAHSDDELSRLVREQILTRVGVHPDHVILLQPGTIPRTSSGKLRRHATLQQYLKQSLCAPKKVSVMQQVALRLKSRWAMRQAENRRAP